MDPLWHRGLTMRATTPFVLSALLLSTALPFAPGAAAWTCVPAQDRTASVVGIGVETYYSRFRQTTGYAYEEVWEESNGEPGLQASAGMSCVGKADVLLHTVCLGYCPIKL